MARQIILFICTGNIFRSMTAGFALKTALGADPAFDVRSAGLIEAPHEILPFVQNYLADKGHDTKGHQPTKLSAALLEQADLAVAMGTEHRDRIEEAFGRRLPLFSEIAYDKVEALLDVYEVVPDWRRNEAAATAYGCSVMDYIFDGMPGFVGRMGSYLDKADSQE